MLFFVSVVFVIFAYRIHAKLSEDRAGLLVKHLDLMRELKTTVGYRNEALNKEIKTANSSTSASDAHLSFPGLKEIVDREWEEFFVTHFDLVDTALERERSHANDYYVFYHAQRKEFRVVQDFIREIFEYIRVCEEQKAFQFLRFWGDIPNFANAENFIDETNKKYGPLWNDHNPEIAKQLLSVNLSLFGNCTMIAAWECSFDYFMASRSVMFAHAELKTLFDVIFRYFGFDNKYISDLIALAQVIDTKEGSLFQIFIPWQIVDDCAYICTPGGVPIANPLKEGDFDIQKGRHVTISHILAQYRKAIPNIDHPYAIDKLQARLVFSWDKLLNPASGIKIYRYTTVSDQALASYKKQLKEIVQTMLRDWLSSNNSCQAIQGTQFATLCDQVKKLS